MYKKFVKKVLVCFVFLGVLYGVFVYNYYERPISTKWIYEAYQKKERYAKNIKEPKIVFTGGSNVLMGISAKKTEEILKIPCVNFGVHAGLRTSYIIYKTKQILKSGDTVIMPLEYSNIYWDGSINDTLVGYILTKDRKYFKSLDFFTKIKMIYSITPYKILKMYIAKIPSVKRKLLKKGYNAKTINENGDETANIGNKYNCKYAIVEFPKNNISKLQGVKEIIKFSDWCKKRNIKFYLTYPNILRIKDFNNKKRYITELERYLKKNDVIVLSDTQKAFYKTKDMYDSKYHLNQIGVKKRTQFIIKLIKDYVL